MSLFILTVYLPADTPPDVDAGRAVVSDLCRHASASELFSLLDDGWITHEYPEQWWEMTNEMFTARAEVLGKTAESALHRLLDAFAASLREPHVARFRLDADTGTGVDVYLDGPSDQSHPWDIVRGWDRFPPGWTNRIGAACGLLHPLGKRPGRRHGHLPRRGRARRHGGGPVTPHGDLIRMTPRTVLNRLNDWVATGRPAVTTSRPTTPAAAQASPAPYGHPLAAPRTATLSLLHPADPIGDTAG